MTDEETIALLRKVDEMRAELRRLEPILSRACVDYGKRRGYTGFRDFHLRNLLNAKVAA
jgi:hypothetical protein